MLAAVSATEFATECLPALHIPDGFVDAPVAAGGWLVAALAVGVAVRRVDRRLEERAVPLMGVMAAFLFAAQLVNFPVAGGTSGHLLGGALAAILLGPWAAILVLTAVVGLQALLFQDGGLLAMGVNIANIAVLTVLVGASVYGVARRLGARGAALGVAAFAAAWLSVVAVAGATALQLALSDTSALQVALPALVGVHLLIGVGEGLITVGALALIRSARPDLIADPVRAGA
jgi:cobalt/nickel transport system permease protein